MSEAGPQAPTPTLYDQEDATLVNWLSTRLDPAYWKTLPAKELRRVLRYYQIAKSRGLPAGPGRVIPRSQMVSHRETSETMVCDVCGTEHGKTLYHCCSCRRIFRSNTAYEQHQEVAEPATDDALRKVGLFLWPSGIWSRRKYSPDGTPESA